MFIQVLPAGAGAKRTGASFICSTVEEWIMGKAFNSILLAVDHCRGGAHAHQQAIVLAKRFRASLRMAYVVNSEDLAIPVPGPPGAPVVKPVVRGTRREAALTAEGREELAAFENACERAAVKHGGSILVGHSEAIWAKEASLCDLVVIRRAEKDFGFFDRWFGSMFWRIVVHSGRPVLVLPRTGSVAERMALFYSNRVESSSALPWVAAFVSALDIPLTVHIAPNSSRGGGYVKECKALLARHQVTAEFLHGGLLKAFAHEFSRPRSGLLECLPLLAFDGGFRRGLWFCRRRRLVERLLRTAAHGILLCPWLTGGETPSRLEEQKKWR
ncbi:MAG: universal stress protein [Planctomycetota bacterium]